MAARDPVIEAARIGAPDRYLAALYAPEPARGRLIALAAFEADLARISSSVREPLLAEIRLQWWRDALASATRGEATGHPVADRLRPDVASGLLPVGLLLGMVDAAADRDLADEQALRTELSKSEGAAFLLAARACGARSNFAVEAAALSSGFAYGLAKYLRSPNRSYDPPPSPLWGAAGGGGRGAERAEESFPQPPSGARAPASPQGGGGAITRVPRTELVAHCRQALGEAAAAGARLDSAVLPAFLPLTMVAVYLRQADGRVSAGAKPLQRWWRMLRASLTNQVP